MARMGVASRPPAVGPARWVLLGWLLSTAFGALFPRLRRRTAWVSRAGPRGIAVYLALHAGGLLFVDWFIRLAGRQSLQRRDMEARLRRELGRPPWPGEIHDAWVESLGFDPLGFDPLDHPLR
jgi:uncharacterized protein YbjT (DUF2867 family)